MKHWPTCKCPVPNCGCAGGMQSYFDHYKTLLKILRPERVIEWGPGPNTQAALDAGAEVLSIEHDRAWMPKGSHPRWACVIAPLDSEWYVDLYGAFNADLAFVDGRRRQECVEMCVNVLRDDAIVCLHDAQRYRYHGALGVYDYVEFLSNGFAVASNDKRLEQLAAQVREEAG